MIIIICRKRPNTYNYELYVAIPLYGIYNTDKDEYIELNICNNFR